jgi:hypothetical protein
VAGPWQLLLSLLVLRCNTRGRGRDDQPSVAIFLSLVAAFPNISQPRFRDLILQTPAPYRSQPCFRHCRCETRQGTRHRKGILCLKQISPSSSSQGKRYPIGLLCLKHCIRGRLLFVIACRAAVVVIFVARGGGPSCEISNPSTAHTLA